MPPEYRDPTDPAEWLRGGVSERRKHRIMCSFRVIPLGVTTKTRGIEAYKESTRRDGAPHLSAPGQHRGPRHAEVRVQRTEHVGWSPESPSPSLGRTRCFSQIFCSTSSNQMTPSMCPERSNPRSSKQRGAASLRGIRFRDSRRSRTSRHAQLYAGGHRGASRASWGCPQSGLGRTPQSRGGLGGPSCSA